MKPHLLASALALAFATTACNGSAGSAARVAASSVYRGPSPTNTTRACGRVAARRRVACSSSRVVPPSAHSRNLEWP